MDPFNFSLNILSCSISYTKGLLEASILSLEKLKLDIMQYNRIFFYISFRANIEEILLRCIISNFNFSKLGILAFNNPLV